MKMLIAIVQPFMAADVAHALQAMPAVTGATFTEVRGFGRATRHMQHDDVVSAEASKVQVVVIVRDEHVEAVAQAIRAAARTGNRGDGKIFVLAVERALHIASDNEGERVV